MGQKVNPLGFRLGVSQKHISHWFIEKNNYAQLVVEDQFIRNYFYKNFPGIASINIKRDLNRIVIEIFSANTRDLLMGGDKVAAKAMFLPSQGKINVATRKDVKQSLTRVASVDGTSVSQGGSSSNNQIDSLCDQLLNALTIFRHTRSQAIALQRKRSFKSRESKELYKNKIPAKFNAKTKLLQEFESRPTLEVNSIETKNPSESQAESNGAHPTSSNQDNTSRAKRSFASPFPPLPLPKQSFDVQDRNLTKEQPIQELNIDPRSSNNVYEFGPQTASGIAEKPVEVELFLTKVENPNTSAACLAEFIVEQLEKRIPFRRVLKRSIQKAEESSVEGIKVQISGRLNGAEIARSERIHKGQVPLHTLRAKIEYNSRTAKTIYGLLGVKVWVFNGFADINETKLLNRN